FTKSFALSSIPLNGTTRLTLTITNPASNTTALTGIGFTDTLPNGLAVAATPALSSTCAGAGGIGSGFVSLASATLAPAATCSVAVNVTGIQAGSWINSTMATSIEAGTSLPAAANITVIAPPAISNAFSPASIPLNGTSTLTFTLTNPNSGS